MKNLLTIGVLMFGLCVTADADVWKWVDAYGNTHFVDTMKPIYTWIDEFDKVHYGDTPDHEDAVAVQLVWVSREALNLVAETSSKSKSGDDRLPGETDEQRAERAVAEAYYCKRATEVLASYLNAPQLYRTNESGEREILSEVETAATIAATKAKKEDYCG